MLLLNAALNMAANLENSAEPKDQKRPVFISIPKKAMPKKKKKSANYYTIVLISHATKVVLKILQVRLQQYVNQELPDVYKLGFEEAEK